MSGMHLMSHAYTTTNTRKRKAKNKTKRLKAAEVEHEKFLQKMGVSDSQLKEKLYDEYGKRKHLDINPNSEIPALVDYSKGQVDEHENRQNYPAVTVKLIFLFHETLLVWLIKGDCHF